jgi:hypothetical protein
MDPLTFIAVASTIGGGVLNAQAASDQAQADAEDLLTKAKLERMRALDVQLRGGIEEGRSRTESSQALSQERVVTAATSEVDTSTGTAARVFGAKGAVAELDALMIRSNAAREAWGHEVQAGMYERAASERQKQGRLAVLGSFLGTAANIGMMARKGGK